MARDVVTESETDAGLAAAIAADKAVQQQLMFDLRRLSLFLRESAEKCEQTAAGAADGNIRSYFWSQGRDFRGHLDALEGVCYGLEDLGHDVNWKLVGITPRRHAEDEETT